MGVWLVIVPLAVGAIFLLAILPAVGQETINADNPANTPDVPPLPNENEGELARIALNLPGLRDWSDEWRVVSIGYRGSVEPNPAYNVAIVYLLLAPEAEAPAFCKGGFAANVQIDLDTREVIDAYYPTEEHHPCPVSFGRTR